MTTPASKYRRTGSPIAKKKASTAGLGAASAKSKAKVATARKTARSNAGGAVRGTARAAQVQGLRKASKGAALRKNLGKSSKRIGKTPVRNPTGKRPTAPTGSLPKRKTAIGSLSGARRITLH